eukprot:COSAG02_NODE_9932_length_2071_cov_1.427992_4_plen_135_part_00
MHKGSHGRNLKESRPHVPEVQRRRGLTLLRCVKSGTLGRTSSIVAATAGRRAPPARRLRARMRVRAYATRARSPTSGKGLPILIVLRDLGEKDGEEKKSWDSSRGKSAVMYPLTNSKGGCRYRHKYENIDGQWV